MALELAIFDDTALPDDLRAALEVIDAAAYAIYPPDSYTWSEARWHVVALLENQPVSYVGLYQRTVTVDGQPVKVAGVGGVMTDPAHGGQGYATKTLRRAEAYMRESIEADFGLLVTGTNLIAFYERLGWQKVTNPLVFTQANDQRYTWEEEVMILPLSDRAWPAGTIDLCGLPW